MITSHYDGSSDSHVIICITLLEYCIIRMYQIVISAGNLKNGSYCSIILCIIYDKYDSLYCSILYIYIIFIGL